MRAIQITVDEALLRGLDSDSETKRHGRSAVIRRALTEYLRRKRAAETDRAIRAGYEGQSGDPQLEGWTEEAAWSQD